MAGLQKILLVEDNYQIRQIYEFVLKKAGFNVVTAADASMAMDAAKKFTPELIFLDIMIPGLNGLELLKIFREDPQYTVQKSKIVLLTNLSHAEDHGVKWDELADGYAVKADILPKDLIEIIRSFE